MHELSISNIEQIGKDIGNQDICFSHLLDELIDHVCCDVENEMSKGYDFDEAYSRVKLKIGPGRFSQIQKETLFAVDTKYRRMKNMMKISGVAGTLIFGCSALFKIQHWPGAGILMTLGAFILALVFLPSALGVLWKETHNKGRMFLMVASFLTGFFFITGALFKTQHWPFAGILLLSSVISGIVLFLPALMIRLFSDPGKKVYRPVYISASVGFIFYIAGFFFKIQHWPLSAILILFGTFLLGFVALPWYTIVKYRNEPRITASFLYIIIAMILIVVPGVMINLNLQVNYSDGYFPSINRQIALNSFLTRHNNLLLDNVNDSIKYRQAQAVRSASLKLIDVVGRIQTGMVQKSSQERGITAEVVIPAAMTGFEDLFKSGNVGYPLSSSVVKNFLLPGCSPRSEIESGIKDYVKTVSGLIPSDKAGQIADLMDPSNFLRFSLPNDEITVITGLHSLELLKNCILAAESDMINIIAKQ
jgi:hypothetical protein